MATQVSLPTIADLPPMGSYELLRIVEEGLPLEYLEDLKALDLTFTEIAQVIPPRTIKHRKARAERLTPSESERLIRVARILNLANQVFGDREKAMEWLRAPDESSENQVSLHLAIATDAGAKRVEDQLWAIDEGMFT